MKVLNQTNVNYVNSNYVKKKIYIYANYITNC